MAAHSASSPVIQPVLPDQPQSAWAPWLREIAGAVNQLGAKTTELVAGGGGTGPAGPPGSTGPAGPTGATGATGPAGSVNMSGMVAGQIPIAATATSVTASANLSGDITSNSTLVTTLANTAVTPAAYTHAAVTVDSKGRLTAAANGTFTGDASLSGNAITLNTVAVGKGGTGLTAGVSGGVPYYSTTTAMTSSALLAAGQVIVGGGAGATPATIANGQLPATATNDSAAAGKVGEHVQSQIAAASAISVSNQVIFNLTSISLTAGDWDVSGVITFIAAGTTVTAWCIVALNATSAALPDTSLRTQIFVPAGAGAVNTAFAPTQRFSLSGTTTIFLVGDVNFSTSTMTACGLLRARRAR